MASKLLRQPYVGTLTTTLSPGQSYDASTTTTQTVDAYGNLTQQQITDYSGSPTGTRTYNMTYTASNSNYTLHYIFNRLLSATVTPSGGSPYTLSSTTYDGSALIATSATNNHDATYGTSFVYRGNPSSVAGLGGLYVVSTAYDSAGVAYYNADSSGHIERPCATPREGQPWGPSMRRGGRG